MTSVATPMPPLRPRWKRLLIDSALARIVIFVLFFAAILMACQLVLRGALGWIDLPRDRAERTIADFLVRVVPSVIAYWLIVRFIEKRPLDELALRKLVPHNAMGFAGGALLIGSVIAILWAAGAYSVASLDWGVQWLRPLLIFGAATAVVEEIIFRGVLFRIMDESWGLWPALIVSALFFGGVHIGNQNATLWSSFAIAVEAGILLGVVYQVTKSLWACIGLHASWNFLQGTIFGSPVSGNPPASSWIRPIFDGSPWLTGGSFGVEASVLTVVLSLIFSAVLLAAARRSRAHNGTLA